MPGLPLNLSKSQSYQWEKLKQVQKLKTKLTLTFMAVTTVVKCDCSCLEHTAHKWYSCIDSLMRRGLGADKGPCFCENKLNMQPRVSVSLVSSLETINACNDLWTQKRVFPLVTRGPIQQFHVTRNPHCLAC